MLLAACAPNSKSLEQAAAGYRQDRQYEGLEIVSRHLPPGTPAAEVQRLLGEPDYCPTTGLCYYSSTLKAQGPEKERNVSIGLVVDYRDARGDTGLLQKSWLGPIEE